MLVDMNKGKLSKEKNLMKKLIFYSIYGFFFYCYGSEIKSCYRRENSQSHWQRVKSKRINGKVIRINDENKTTQN
jgi:hypothetical protein